MTRRTLAVALLLTLGLVLSGGSEVVAQTATDQSVLGPGLYVFQTRTVSASCGDDERTGYVASFVAAVDGVPGSRSMNMHVVDNRYWSTWALTVDASGTVAGESLMDGTSGASRPRYTFHLTRDATGRFTGQAVRSYTTTVAGAAHECTVTSDALLRRIDV